MKLIPNEVYLTNKNRRLKCIENIKGRDIVIMQDFFNHRLYYFNKKGESGYGENIIGDSEDSASEDANDEILKIGNITSTVSFDETITGELKNITSKEFKIEQIPSLKEIALQILPSILIAIPNISAENAVKYSRVVTEAFLEEFKDD